jgi:hypothetical protein
VDDFIHTSNGLDWTKQTGALPIAANYILD